MSDAIVEEVRSRADLIEICGERTTLKRVGKSWRGPCPLHGGDGPNFAVDPARGIFKCFVCGEGGDVFSFVMKSLGFDFPEAVRHVAKRVGVEVPDREAREEDPHRGLREVAAFAREWFLERLRSPEGEPARRYLERRGLSLDSAAERGLGWAPDEWRALRAAAHARGIGDDPLLELGLLATSERAEEPYDRFRGRLVFTIFDLRDRPIGFGGRWLGSDDASVPKYINSTDSPIFHKGRTLYGLNWARHAIRREGRAAVVEGYTDVLALHLEGLPLAVAGLGTAFTAEQAEALARYADRAFLLYDSDDAGLRATFKAADALLAAGVHPMVVTLPEGEDPDSLVRARGLPALRALLGDAVDVLERKLQILERQGYLERIEGRRRAIDGLLSTLRATRDPALRDIYLDRAAERLGVRRETLVHEVARDRPPARPSPVGRAPAPEDATGPPPPPAEHLLLLLLLRDPSLVGAAAAAGVEPAHFRHPTYRHAYRALLGPEGGTGSGWRDRLAPEDRAAVEALAVEETELTHPGEIFQESVRRLLVRPRLERLAEIDRELELAEEDQARKLLMEKQEIAAELRGSGFPLSFLHRRTGEELATTKPARGREDGIERFR